MFRAITKGLGELLKRRGSTELPEIPRVSTAALKGSVDQGQALETPLAAQPLPRRSSTASSMSLLSKGAGSSSVEQIKPSTALSSDNFVRVRLWTSKTSEGQDTYGARVLLERVQGKSANIGHATLETKNVYASIWPDDDGRLTTSIEFPSYFSKAVDDDIKSERNRQPDYIIDFYSLNVPEIEALFK